MVKIICLLLCVLWADRQRVPLGYKQGLSMVHSFMKANYDCSILHLLVWLMGCYMMPLRQQGLEITSNINDSSLDGLFLLYPSKSSSRIT